MARISGIGFSNFRVFEKANFFDFAPLTVFTGTNNSGKSSIFKGLQLLNNNAIDLGILDFSGEGHKLGTYMMAKSRNSTSDIIKFIIEIEDSSLLIIEYKKISSNDEGGIWNKVILTIDKEYKENYDRNEVIVEATNEGTFAECFYNIKYLHSVLQSNISTQGAILWKWPLNARKWENDLKISEWNFEIISKSKLRDFFPTLDKENFDLLISIITEKFLSILSLDESVQSFLANTEVVEVDLYEVLKNGFDKLHNHTFSFKAFLLKPIIKEAEIPIQIAEISDITLADLIDDTFMTLFKDYFEKVLLRAVDTVRTSTKMISYIEAVRANSQRLYSNQSQGTSFNKLLLNIGQHGKGNNEFLEKWLNKFGIGEKLYINRIKGIATEVSILYHGEKVDLIDLGHGVTQLLPILLYICSKVSSKLHYESVSHYTENFEPVYKTIDERFISKINGPLLLVEEPESNLHPKLQSLLADFFIDVAKHFHVTLLIETHSEYLIRRLQVITAAGEAKPEDSVIYYLDGNVSSESDKFVRKINISKDGSLSNDFGPGFIDEATNWKMELMRLKNAQVHNLN